MKSSIFRCKRIKTTIDHRCSGFKSTDKSILSAPTSKCLSIAKKKEKKKEDEEDRRPKVFFNEVRSTKRLKREFWEHIEATSTNDNFDSKEHPRRYMSVSVFTTRSKRLYFCRGNLQKFNYVRLLLRDNYLRDNYRIFR